MTAWARRTRCSLCGEVVPAPLPTLRVKRKSAPVCGSGPGERPHSFLFRLPRKRGGRRADKAHCPDCSGRCPDYSGRMGVKRHAPRLAARQRGILAFMPLTVVGPGRVHSARRGCPSTARGRGCVLHRSQVPLPFPAFKTPPEGAPRRVDRDMSPLAKISPYVKSRFRYYKRNWEMVGNWVRRKSA
jgi:hypothetical protein